MAQTREAVPAQTVRLGGSSQANGFSSQPLMSLGNAGGALNGETITDVRTNDPKSTNLSRILRARLEEEDDFSFLQPNAGLAQRQERERYDEDDDVFQLPDQPPGHLPDHPPGQLPGHLP
ncbi:hypothetical protein FRC01_005814, partial [Tulasnella sp. 417]